ncbi:MAG: hypothetical protein N2557_06095 [Hydrogenophilus sp.]|nr:hypothetical protein [Hydrogenophilus sp.]
MSKLSFPSGKSLNGKTASPFGNRPFLNSDATSHSASGAGSKSTPSLFGSKSLTPISSLINTSLTAALSQIQSSASKNPSTGQPPLPVTLTLAAASDTDPLGDNATTLASARLEITGIAHPNALVWLDRDGDGQFNATKDQAIPITDPTAGKSTVTLSLLYGPNTFTVYQTLDGKNISPPAFLTITREGVALTPPPTPSLTLFSLDDDGTVGDLVTTKSLVRLTVDNLDPNRQTAWIDTNGNGTYDLTKDIAIPPGGSSRTISVPLVEGVNGFQAYQTRDGLTSSPGIISIFRLKDTDVVRPGQSSTYAGKTISLEFDRPVDWAVLDTNRDGKLDVKNLNQPGDTGELTIGWGSSGQNPPIIDNAQLAAALVDIPPYGSRFLTITGASITRADLTQPLAGNLTLILVSIPDLQGGVFSNIIFDF